MTRRKTLLGASASWDRSGFCLKLTSALALLSAAPGCSTGDEVPAACAGEHRCPAPSNTLSWALQLSPNSATAAVDPQSPLMPQDRHSLIWSSDGETRIEYRPTAQVYGNVLDSQAMALSGARVVARLNSAIPGQNDYSLGTLTTDQPALNFTLRVPLAQQPTEQPYHFWVGFDDSNRASLAPSVWQEAYIRGDNHSEPLSLRLRKTTELAAVTGRIVSALGEGVGNLTVQVLDPSRQIVSSTAISDATAGPTKGNYRVLVDPKLSGDPNSSLTVVVRPGPLDPTLPILEATLQTPHAGTETRVDFAEPAYRFPASFSLPIRGGPDRTSAVPVTGARVRAQVMLEDATTLKLGIRAYYTAMAESDAQGIARLSLVPAPIGGPNLIYQVSISSPSHVPFASVPQTALSLGSSDGGVLGPITLPLRTEVRGRLLSAQGTPAAGVEVVANRIAGDERFVSPLSSVLVSADLPESTTDSAGSFALRLDPGDYDFEFIPNPSLEARSSLDNQRVRSDNLDLGEIYLPSVTLGALKVLSPAGSPVAETKVRIFELPDVSAQLGVSCDLGWPCSRNAKLRAEVFTDKEGRARCLLPASRPRRASP